MTTDSLRLTSLEGNRQFLDGGSMFGNAPRTVWENWIAPDERGRIPLACRSLLVEWQTGNRVRRILCETGIGAFFEPKLADRFGVQTPDRHRLRENLSAIGIEESDIDVVILSHLHFDHAGGLLPTYAEIQGGNESLLFPKAQYWVGKQAWERAQNPHFRDRASFIPGLCEKLTQSGRLKIIDTQAPGDWSERLSFRISNGHTPGQMLTLVRGNRSSVFFCGDLIPGLPWVHLPITMGYDRNPELLIDEKKELYDSGAITEKWLLFYTHDSENAASMVQRNEKGKITPVQVQKELRNFEL